MLAVVALAAAGRRTAARALAGFLPDVLVLLRRLLAEPGVSRPRKLALAAALAYVSFPLDLVPDFIPVAGQLDDVLVLVLAVRGLVRAEPGLLARHWPGPPSSLRVVERACGIRPDRAGTA